MAKTITIRLEEEEIEMLKELQIRYLKQYGQAINQTQFFRKVLREEFTRVLRPSRAINVDMYKDLSNR